MTVLSWLQTGLSHIYQSSTLRPLNSLASPSVSLHSQVDITGPLYKLNSISPPSIIATVAALSK